VEGWTYSLGKHNTGGGQWGGGRVHEGERHAGWDASHGVALNTGGGEGSLWRAGHIFTGALQLQINRYG